MTGKGKSLNVVLTFCLGMSAPWVYPADGHMDKPALADVKDSSWFSAFSGWKLPDSVQIHGFASQSYIYTTGNEFFGHSTDTGSLGFTEMGINGSWRPISELQTSLQVVYRRAGRTDNQDLRIDFGLLDYNFYSDSDNTLGIRLGRVINPYGFYNDTRDMPFTRPSILLPQSIYFDVNRNFSLSSDGLQIYAEHRTDLGDLFLQVNGGFSRTNDPDLKFVVARNLPGDLSGRLSWIGRLMYEWNAGTVRLGVTSGEVNAGYNPKGDPGVNLPPGRLAFSPIMFSAQYNTEFISLTAEYALRNSQFSGFDSGDPDRPFIPDMDFTGESYYIQGSYRFMENWEAYLRYDVAYQRQSDRSGKVHAYQSALQGGHDPAYGQFAKDITVGVRWDLNSYLMLRSEYHRINGTLWTSDLENSGTYSNGEPKTEQHWDLFSMSVNLRF